jgi:adenylosuccinate lyase
MILPDHFGLLSYTLRRCTSIIQNLEIHKDKIESKITNSFSFLSSYILHEMILINETSRENLYALIQESSFSSATTDDFFNQIKAKCEKENLNFPQSISIEKLKSHYINEFKKIRNRTQN